MTTSLQHLWRWIDFRQAGAESACDAVDGAQKPASGHARKERVLLARSLMLCTAPASPPTRTGPTAPSRGSRFAPTDALTTLRISSSNSALRLLRKQTGEEPLNTMQSPCNSVKRATRLNLHGAFS